MSATPSLLTHLIALLVVLVAVGPLVTLLHELAHAVVSLWLGGGEAEVQVGRGRGARVRLGRLAVAFNPIPRGSPFRGRCVRRGVIRSAGTELAVVLAGPAATALTALGLGLAAIGMRNTDALLMLTLAYGSAFALVAFLVTFDAERVLPVWRVWRRGGVLPHHGAPLT